MKKITKILIIISIVIIAVGIYAGVSVSTELSSGIEEMENQSIDGSDVTHIVKAGVTLGALFMGCIVTFWFGLAVCVIWIIYGIILLIIKIANKRKKNNPNM